MKESLSRREFDILALTAESAQTYSQRQLEEQLPYSLSSVNRAVKELTERGFLAQGRATAEGIMALEPYRVKRAIFIAAGFGARLAPITLNTPKPLVRVHGKRIIDGLIDAVCSIGVREIVIVRGYLSDQFDQLLYKYPMIQFLENPAYNETNNISSAMCARYLFGNAYVFEADLLIRNPSVLRKYHYCSDFLGIRKVRSDDWCATVRDGVITDFKIGGLDCYQTMGISYWNAEDGKKLSGHIKEAYEMPGGRELFWDQAPLKIFRQEYRVELAECQEGDVIEIDTFRELKAIDRAYEA